MGRPGCRQKTRDIDLEITFQRGFIHGLLSAINGDAHEPVPNGGFWTNGVLKTKANDYLGSFTHK